MKGVAVVLGIAVSALLLIVLMYIKHGGRIG